jgi:hypothetical protein
MTDWYRDHALSPEAHSDDEYRDWAQDQGLCVDAAGNVDYGAPERDSESEPAYVWELGDDE